jgi:hypothetical protein
MSSQRGMPKILLGDGRAEPGAPGSRQLDVEEVEESL